jgi:hypothetical protein
LRLLNAVCIVRKIQSMSSSKNRSLQVKPEPASNYDSNSAFSKWIRSTPHVPEGGYVTITVNLRLIHSRWCLISEGMSRNGVTVDEAISHLLEESDIANNWANGEFDMSEETDEVLPRLMTGTGATALAKMWPDVSSAAEKLHLSVESFVGHALKTLIDHANNTGGEPKVFDAAKEKEEAS